MSERYIPSGVSKVVVAPAVANLAAPTRSEINAGTVLSAPGVDQTDGLIALEGFESESSNITTPDVSSDFDTTIPGRESASDGKISCYDPDDGVSAKRTALAEGTVAVVIIMKNGDVAGRRCQCWPIRVSALNDSQVNADNSAATWTAAVTFPRRPRKDAVVPA